MTLKLGLQLMGAENGYRKLAASNTCHHAKGIHLEKVTFFLILYIVCVCSFKDYK